MKLKHVVIILIIFVMLTSFYTRIVDKSVSRFNGYTIVLDAGHGGRDGGSVGKNGTIEKDINLEYVFALKEKLVTMGYRVELTRKNDDGLYSPLAKNKKQSDMQERYRIIQKINPNLVISIHMNSFSDSSASGATTYFRTGDDSGKHCADLIQKSLKTYCGAKMEKAKVGDYYILNCSYYTAVLIECGFLSNLNEEALLNTADYRNKIVNAITKAILLYFGQTGV